MNLVSINKSSFIFFYFQLDSTCDGYVDWNEFCTYLLLLYRENDYMSTKREIPFLAEAKITHVIHNRVGYLTVEL